MEYLFNPKVLGSIVVGAITIILFKKFFIPSSEGDDSSSNNRKKKKRAKKDDLVDEGDSNAPREDQTLDTETKSSDSTVIIPKEFRHFKLKEKTTLTTGVCPVRRYRFTISDSSKSLGLPVGQHIELRAMIDGNEVRRKYTPTSSNDDKGYFDLVIKVYPKGLMSQYVDNLSIGDSIEVCGPRGLFIYKKNKYKKIGMIAGGTGITPMLQIITEILKHSDDQTTMSLLFGNLTIQDIILHDKIDKLASEHQNFDAYHVLNEPPEGWKQGVGFITADMIKDRLPPPENDNIILLCGPGPMIDAMKKHLKTLGYERKHIFSF